MGRVMVVDDEPDMRLAVRLILERYGHTVEEAASGEDAYQRVQGAPPDLLLMDVRMPGQDGLVTLGKIRESNKTMPVIIMTGYGNPETEREAFRKGANHYILKPFRNEDLMEAMSQAGLADAEATPARVMEPMVERRHVRHSVVMDRIQPVLRHVLNVLRQAKAVFLDRWYNPPILFERDPSFEERISLRLSLITDPIKVIFYGLFDKEFEFPMDERAEEMRPSRPPAEEEPGPIHPPPMDRPLPRFSSIDMTPEPVEMEPGVERVHQDLSLQINSLAQSLQAQIGKLAEQIQQRPEAPKAPDPMPDPLPGSRESPQEEFHRLLIELQASWDQGLTGLEKELSVSQELLNEWNKTLPVLRQTVDRPQAA